MRWVPIPSPNLTLTRDAVDMDLYNDPEPCNRSSVNLRPERTPQDTGKERSFDSSHFFVILQFRRMEKKANKTAFKSEKQRQEQSMMNTKLQQGKKL